MRITLKALDNDSLIGKRAISISTTPIQGRIVAAKAISNRIAKSTISIRTMNGKLRHFSASNIKLI